MKNAVDSFFHMFPCQFFYNALGRMLLIFLELRNSISENPLGQSRSVPIRRVRTVPCQGHVPSSGVAALVAGHHGFRVGFGHHNLNPMEGNNDDRRDDGATQHA